MVYGGSAVGHRPDRRVGHSTGTPHEHRVAPGRFPNVLPAATGTLGGDIMTGKWIRLTEQEAEEWRSMYEDECLSTQQIADRLGISRTAVMNRLAKAGVTLRSAADGIRLAGKQGRLPGGRGRGKQSPELIEKRRQGMLRYYTSRRRPIFNKCTGRYIINVGNGKHRHYARVLMERHLGRKLRNDEVVHHIDCDKSNDDISNLRVMTPSEHMSLHNRLRARNSGTSSSEKNNSEED